MDQAHMIQTKIKALISARNCLLSQQPSDLVTISHITEMIIELSAHHIGLIDQSKVPTTKTKKVKK